MDNGNVIPIYMAGNGKLITVFGGGNVALRKIRHFEGFTFRAVSKEFLPEVKELAETIPVDNLDEATISRYIEGSFMAIAATSVKAINMEVCRIAKSKGIPVNSAHDGGDVLIPSVLRHRNFSVCISTEGKVPGFPPLVAKRLDDFFDDSYDMIIDLMLKIRPVVKEKVETQPARAEILRAVINDTEIWTLLSEGKEDEAFAKAQDIMRRMMS